MNKRSKFVPLLFILQGSPELLEVKMGTEGYSEGSDEKDIDNDQDDVVRYFEYLHSHFPIE